MGWPRFRLRVGTRWWGRYPWGVVWSVGQADVGRRHDCRVRVGRASGGTDGCCWDGAESR